jgi:hypothetical protein
MGMSGPWFPPGFSVPPATGAAPHFRLFNPVSPRMLKGRPSLQPL